MHSNQPGVHPGLGRIVQRHLGSRWQKPAQRVDLPALRELDQALAQHDGALVLDSFCGTGYGTALLAARYPAALVIGVDKSAHRLRRHQGRGDYLLLQAHCEAVWRHLAARGRRLHAHYILYPNPWPKASQLARRVHGHPAFPLLLQLGGALQLRSNWQPYVEEFGIALHLAGYVSRVQLLSAAAAPLTPFERKYRDSGHALWRLDARLDSPLAAVKDTDACATLHRRQQENAS